MGLYDRDYMRQAPVQEAGPGAGPARSRLWRSVLLVLLLVLAILAAMLVTH